MNKLPLKFSHGALMACLFFGYVQGAPAPELPGEEVTEAEAALKKSDKMVTEIALPKIKGKNKWTAPSINEQLARDKTLIGLGYGALFIPAFTESRVEPEILVNKQGGGKLTPGNSGQRILLQEGSYIIRVGSGNLDQRMKYLVSIKEGKTTVVKPEWAGLVVEVLDSDGDYSDEEYDVYYMESGEPFGKGYGLEDERIKDLKTWILKPGVYKITKVGESLGSFKNYITVQLNPGELTTLEIVFDKDTRELIAGGIKDLSAKRKVGLNWRYGMRAGGNISFNNKIVNFEEEKRTTSTLLDFKMRAKYDNTKFLGINEIRTKNIFQWEKDKAPSSVTDDIRLRSSWVRRINRYVGPYISFKLESHFFPIKQPLGGGELVFLENKSGAIEEMVANVDILTQDTLELEYPGIPMRLGKNFETSPSFFPLQMGAGLGVNLELLTYYNFELSTQVGMGARPIINRNQLAKESETSNTWVPLDSDIKVGLENTINNRLRIGSKVTLDTEAELFFENGVPTKLKVEQFTSDLRLSLTRFFEISYIFEVNDRVDQFGAGSSQRFEYENGILLRISVNL